MKTTKHFIVEDGIASKGLRGIYLFFEDLKITESNSEFTAYKDNIIDDILLSLSNGEDSFKNDSILLGFRKLHENFGAPNRKNLSSPENLYKLLVKNRDIPNVNLLVDIYNLVSIKYKLALGAHDLSKIDGDIRLGLTSGNEKFIPLGANEPKPVEKGMYSYIDDNNEIICYLEVRQVNKTKVTIDTNSCFIIIQGNMNTPINYIREAESLLVSLLKKYCGGKEYLLSVVTDS